mmetsp:Transcript_14835/g.28272  ORF Transcript_14835/g.28272 Transcript_14835/m.28272 type:complete len:352 (+) Transcript_14835:544-1599(+)
MTITSLDIKRLSSACSSSSCSSVCMSVSMSVSIPVLDRPPGRFRHSDRVRKGQTPQSTEHSSGTSILGDLVKMGYIDFRQINSLEVFSLLEFLDELVLASQGVIIQGLHRSVGRVKLHQAHLPKCLLVCDPALTTLQVFLDFLVGLFHLGFLLIDGKHLVHVPTEHGLQVLFVLSTTVLVLAPSANNGLSIFRQSIVCVTKQFTSLFNSLFLSEQIVLHPVPLEAMASFHTITLQTPRFENFSQGLVPFLKFNELGILSDFVGVDVLIRAGLQALGSGTKFILAVVNGGRYPCKHAFLLLLPLFGSLFFGFFFLLFLNLLHNVYLFVFGSNLGTKLSWSQAGILGRRHGHL